jgi:hypothetical protein
MKKMVPNITHIYTYILKEDTSVFVLYICICEVSRLLKNNNNNNNS